MECRLRGFKEAGLQYPFSRDEHAAIARYLSGIRKQLQDLSDLLSSRCGKNTSIANISVQTLVSATLLEHELLVLEDGGESESSTESQSRGAGMRSIKRKSQIAASAFLLVTAASASEVIHFRSGFDLGADSHVIRGRLIEITTGAGTMAIPAEEVSKIDVLAEMASADTPLVATPHSSIAGTSTPKQVTPELVLSEAAITYGIDEAFVRSVAQIESGLQQERRSRKGAIGIMQLMPATAKGLGVDPSRLEENARGGVQYLRHLLIKFQGDSALVLAAYNAGPGAVQKYRGIPPYLETRRYVLSVLREYKRQLKLLAVHSEFALPNGLISPSP